MQGIMLPTYSNTSCRRLFLADRHKAASINCAVTCQADVVMRFGHIHRPGSSLKHQHYKLQQCVLTSQ